MENRTKESTKDFFEKYCIQDKGSQAIHCLHSSFEYGSRRATGEGKKKNSKNPKLLKKANGERKAVISLSQEEMTEGNIT